MVENTIYFNGSILGKPVHHTKFLFKENRLYKIESKTEVQNRWSFKRKSRKPTPYKNYN